MANYLPAIRQIMEIALKQLERGDSQANICNSSIGDAYEEDIHRNCTLRPGFSIKCSACPFNDETQLEEAMQQIDNLIKIQEVHGLIGAGDSHAENP